MTAYFDLVYSSIRNRPEERWQEMSGYYATTLRRAGMGKDTIVAPHNGVYGSVLRVCNLGVSKSKSGLWLQIFTEYKAVFSQRRQQWMYRLEFAADCSAFWDGTVDTREPSVRCSNGRDRFLYWKNHSRWVDVYHMSMQLMRTAKKDAEARRQGIDSCCDTELVPHYLELIDNSANYSKGALAVLEKVPACVAGRNIPNLAPMVWRNYFNLDAMNKENIQAVREQVAALELDGGKDEVLAELRQYTHQEECITDDQLWEAFKAPWYDLISENLPKIHVLKLPVGRPYLYEMNDDLDYATPGQYSWLLGDVQLDAPQEEEPSSVLIWSQADLDSL